MITTNRFIYLIKFQTSFENFIIQDTELLGLLKLREKAPIEYIKVYDEAKQKFKTLSKKKLKSMHTWDTELTEVLNKRRAI